MTPLPGMVEALLSPPAYPDNPSRVELVQTQMSFVFLTDNHVYKVKKAVDLGYLDYTTLDKRQFFCQQEVKLNRRLGPEVYLGVVPICRTKDGLSVEGSGEVLEYAVKMRRLPAEAMMDSLLLQNGVSTEMAIRLAGLLADFHRRAETNPEISTFGGLDIITGNTRENFEQTEKYINVTLSAQGYQDIKGFTEGFIRQNGRLFDRRVTEGRIRDCHGDLHAAHICFTNGICIYDCIEFNDRFRYGDVASEVAFLAMDIDHYARTELSREFVTSYVESSGDAELWQLLNFYKCYRAYVRGKVESFKLDDPNIRDEDKVFVLNNARSYFSLAESYTEPEA